MPMFRRFALAVICGAFALPAFAAADTTDNWPQWRGPLATGAAPRGNPPLIWSEADGTNIRWKAAVPGRGHSTPIVWDNHIFLTTAIPSGEALPPRPSSAPGNHDNLPVTHRHQFVALALDRSTGKTLWQRTLHEALPQEQGHHTASLASNSAVTDGEHVIAFFGSHGLFCLDLDGNLVWKTNFGPILSLHGHGESTSPVLFEHTLIVNCDHEGESFIAAFDKRTGQQLWRFPRDEVSSWSTPIVIEQSGIPQVVVTGTKRIRGYDLATGKVLWECGGLSSNIVASPVSADGFVFAGSSYDTRSLLAISLDGAAGDLTGTRHVAWSRSRGTPYVPSPLLYDGGLYFLTHYQGIMTRVDPRTGEDRPGTFRLPGITNVYASPVAAANRIYVTDLNGTTLVIQSGDLPRLLAQNQLSEPISASAAIVGRELFLRGDKHLYCLAEP